MKDTGETVLPRKKRFRRSEPVAPTQSKSVGDIQGSNRNSAGADLCSGNADTSDTEWRPPSNLETCIAVGAEARRGKNLTDQSDREKYIVINNCKKKPPISISITLGTEKSSDAKKKQRLTFFNSFNGILLRLAVDGPVTDTGEDLHCPLCGINNRESKASGSKGRGHKTVFKCTDCGVNLCMKRRAYDLCCYQEWHCNIESERRVE